MFCSAVSKAQMFEPNQESHDDKPYHFGINIGYNESHFNFTHSPRFLQYDSIMDVESINNPGINLAWLVNVRISDHFDLRVHPLDLTFSEEAFLYTQKYDPETSVTQKLQSITMSFPFNIAFSSDRIKNYKVYVLAGGKYDYDLASNKGLTNVDDQVKLNRSNISGEVGLGFHIYFPYFVLSPEIKLSDGLTNLHDLDPTLKYSNVIDKIYSRMVTFSLTVE
ncbi:MAG TPA: outer membrane beta-barrel protein [Hanamia sp.]|nr:outer membrane beta-barrel protein [Hanamia sp.]